jgi:hypothetical protein
MSELLDGLARTLATPMSRGRALRLLAAAGAAAAFPGSRKAWAAESQPVDCPKCDSNHKLCKHIGVHRGSSFCLGVCAGENDTCCYFTPEESGYTPWGLIVGCPAGTRCGSARPNHQRCICNYPCGDDCCLRGEHCVPGSAVCRRCPRKRESCGPGLHQCCELDEHCSWPRKEEGFPENGVCCPKGQLGCGRKGNWTFCCPQGQHCCHKNGKGYCCGGSAVS